MLGFGPLGSAPLGALPLDDALRKTLTERGLVQIVNAHSPISVGEIRGKTVDYAGEAIAQSRPIYAPEKGRSGKAVKSGKVSARRTKDKGRRAAPNYWVSVKAEIFLLLCTQDKKYATLRKQLAKEGSATQMTIVSMVSSAVGASAGVVAGAAVPLVALCLLVALRIGTNALCAQFDDVKI